MLPDNPLMPIKIAILAMGGEGGGVLADWIVSTAEHAGFHAQNTSVPGVAQRTGATLYYVEILPVPRADSLPPILGLMPVPGDVDIVLASELMEAARAVQRGLVTEDRTLLITSTNRVYAMPEKMAMGDGRQDAGQLRAAGERAARQFVGQDFAALAEQHGSIISAVLFGALAASGALPLARAEFEATITRSGVGVASSLAAFQAGFQAYEAPAPAPQPAEAGGAASLADTIAADSRLETLMQRIARDFPAAAHTVLQAGVARTADYQDLAYAGEYLDRLAPIRAVTASDGQLLQDCARHLALWMTFEDTVRVAELKIRQGRFARVSREYRQQPGQLLQINEFLHPRLEEVADSLPAGLGRWLLRNAWARRLGMRLTRKGRVVRSNSLGGFLLLYGVASLRALRRRSLRFLREQAAIRVWLETIQRYAAAQPALACEIAACQNLVKGYGDTHARGWANYQRIIAALPRLAGLPDAAQRLAALRQAALADEQGERLAELLP
ncbi:indolepyruvate oxidoreductase subunit beta family protein [Kerstersia sp.]|uniref:indolepyruvate oxidoreductase subunit beta family protein n=1 Tax=Kerstersia sp. TaxID=1930783 RepID=UPI003F93B746